MSGEKMRKDRDKLVAGIDILPGYSPSSRQQPHYALVFVKNNEITDSYEDVSFTRLIRLLWEKKPEILAVDNVFELATDIDGLKQVIQLLPPQTIIVQVTGWGPHAVNIKTLAREYGLEIHGKLTPLKTAYIAAVIAGKGGGYKIKLLEEKTKIIISKSRTVSHGGMSYDRYRRSINASILAATREVKRKLDRNGFDYDLTFRKGEGGLERSIFTVYAPREKLYGIIKPFKNKNVKLIIKPVYKNKLVMAQNTPKSKPGLILGIDPGIYTGFALVDLSGRPIYTYSSKNLDRGDILGMISGMGKIVAVATDVAHPPELVRKIAAALNAQLYIPPRDLSNDEKRTILNTILEKYPSLEVDDTHERDALVAAYKAYQSLSDKLRQAEHHIDEIDLDIDREAVKIMIAKGQSIAEAIEAEIDRIVRNNLKDKTTDQEDTKPSIENEEVNTKITKLQEKINGLIAENIALKKKLAEKEIQLQNLEVEIKTLRTTQRDLRDEAKRKINLLMNTISHLRNRIEELNKNIEELRRQNKRLKQIINEIITNEYRALPKYTNPSSIPLDKIAEYKGKAIYVHHVFPLDKKAVNILKRNKIAIVTSDDCDCRELTAEYRIPFIKIDSCSLIFYEDKVLVKLEDIDHVLINEWKRIEELDSEDEYKRVIELVRKYKEKRKRIFGKKYDEIL